MLKPDFQKLKYIKAITSRSRGLMNSHMFRIVHSLIRSGIEYGTHLLFDFLQSGLSNLEVSYNCATGLLRWMPIPVFRWKAGASSVASRLFLLIKIFLLCVSGLDNFYQREFMIHSLISPNPRWKW